MAPMVRVVWVALLFAACAQNTAPAAAPPAAVPPAAPALPDTAGAQAFLEEIATLARSALLRQPLPAGRLPIRADAGGEIISFEPQEQLPPVGAIRRLYVLADTALAFADGGCL